MSTSMALRLQEGENWGLFIDGYDSWVSTSPRSFNHQPDSQLWQVGSQLHEWLVEQGIHDCKKESKPWQTN